MSLISSFTSPLSLRRLKWQSYPRLANNNTAFAFAVGSLIPMLIDESEPFTFRYADIHVVTAAGNVELIYFRFDGTNLVPVATSGSIVTAGANANQQIDFGARLEYRPGSQPFFVALLIENIALRLLTGNVLAAQSPAMRITSLPGLGGLGMVGQKTGVALAAGGSHAPAGFLALGQPVPWIALYDSV